MMKTRWKHLIAGVLFGLLVTCLNVFPAWSRAPMAFTDDMGRAVTLAKEPRRVVSLVPSITEILFRIGAGDQVVGVTYHNRYPSEAAVRPIIGGFFHPDPARVRELKPDIVFHAQLQNKAIGGLQQGPWRLINLEIDSIEDSYATIRLLGRMFKQSPQAEAVILENQRQLDLIARKTAKTHKSEKKRVMRLMGRKKLMVPGDDSFQNELIRAAGGIPPRLGKKGSVVEMTKDEFIAFNPQVIYGCGGDRETAIKFFNQEGYRDVSAVKNKQIHYFPCDLTCRVATNTGYFVNWLSARIYQNQYAQSANQVYPDQMIDTRDITVDLPYIQSARIVNSRIADFDHKTLVIEFNHPMKILSTLEGQRANIRVIGNHYSPPPYWGIGHQHGLEHIRSAVMAVLGQSADAAAFLFTGANMDNLAIQEQTFKRLTVWVLVTAGVRSNAVRTSRDEGRFYEPGTINMLLLANAQLSPRAMSRAVITATEAKAAALADMDIRSAYLSPRYQATGTGTDNLIVAQGNGTPIENTGGHSKMGELIAKAVYQGVREAVFKQNGLFTRRHIFARLAERHITPYSLLSSITCDCVPDTSAAGAELEAVLMNPRYAGFVETALALNDDYEAGLIADTQAFETWCDRIALEIAGGALIEKKARIDDPKMPLVLKKALNALLSGVYARLTPQPGDN